MYLELGYKLLEVSGNGAQRDAGWSCANLLGQLGWLHLGLDNLQSDSGVAQVLVVEQLCAVAYGKAAFSQLGAGFILQTLWIAHQLGRRISVYRRGRHLVVVVDGRCDGPRTPKLCLFGSLLGELRTGTVRRRSCTHDPCRQSGTGQPPREKDRVRVKK